MCSELNLKFVRVRVIHSELRVGAATYYYLCESSSRSNSLCAIMTRMLLTQIRQYSSGFENECWKATPGTQHVVVCSSEMQIGVGEC